MLDNPEERARTLKHALATVVLEDASQGLAIRYNVSPDKAMRAIRSAARYLDQMEEQAK